MYNPLTKQYKMLGGKGDDWVTDIHGKEVDPLYAYSSKGKMHITRDGYAQIVGGWLEFSYTILTKRQITKIDLASKYLEDTGKLWISSRRNGFDVYALPLDAKDNDISKPSCIIEWDRNSVDCV